SPVPLDLEATPTTAPTTNTPRPRWTPAASRTSCRSKASTRASSSATAGCLAPTSSSRSPSKWTRSSRDICRTAPPALVGTRAPPRYVYVMVAAPSGPKPAYNASNGYVGYLRDRAGSAHPADEYVFSQSNYSNYGNAPKGDICGAPSAGHPYGTPDLDANGKPVIARHRPLDTTTVQTPRYSFRYAGRWLMTGISVSPDNGGLSTSDYGPNVVDLWKARAFDQDPSSKTHCCGFEE